MVLQIKSITRRLWYRNELIHGRQCLLPRSQILHTNFAILPFCRSQKNQPLCLQSIAMFEHPADEPIHETMHLKFSTLKPWVLNPRPHKPTSICDRDKKITVTCHPMFTLTIIPPVLNPIVSGLEAHHFIFLPFSMTSSTLRPLLRKRAAIVAAGTFRESSNAITTSSTMCGNTGSRFFSFRSCIHVPRTRSVEGENWKYWHGLAREWYWPRQSQRLRNQSHKQVYRCLHRWRVACRNDRLHIWLAVSYPCRNPATFGSSDINTRNSRT